MIAFVTQKSGSFPKWHIFFVPHNSCLWDGDVLTAAWCLMVCVPCQAIELNLDVDFGRGLGLAIILPSLKRSSKLHLNVSYGSWEGDTVQLLNHDLSQSVSK